MCFHVLLFNHPGNPWESHVRKSFTLPAHTVRLSKGLKNWGKANVTTTNNNNINSLWMCNITRQ